MKIKKVEIEAFRAFDKISDSTFDFTLEDKTTANFVSIYAPNGYGKTSFYDAVEWGVTGQISRFRKNAPENTKANRENKKFTKNQFLLQHNGQNNLGSVKIVCDSSTDIFPKKHITNSKVYDFSNEGENLFFKNVMLSQDLIDSFIKADKADERYKEFIRNIPSLNEYNVGLQNIIRLHENTEEELSKLNRDLGTLEQTKLDFDFEDENKILEEINKSILVLINNKEDLRLIDKQLFTKNELAALTQKVEARIIAINSDLDSINSQIIKIDNASSGSEEIKNEVGIVNYYILKEKLNNLTNERNSFLKSKALLNEKISIEKSILSLINKLSEIIKSISTISQIKSQFSDFENLKKNIKDSEKEKYEISQTLNKLGVEKKELVHSQNDIEIELKKLETEISTYKVKQDKIPLTKTRIIEIKELKEKSEKEIADIESIVKYNTDRLFIVNETIKNIEFYYNKLKGNDIDVLNECPYLVEYNKHLNQLQSSNIAIKELQNKLIKIDAEINTRKGLNSDLEHLISKGLEIVDLNESSTCPLCSANYDSYKILSEKISNNPLLADALNENFKEKAAKEKETNDYKITISEIIQQLEKELSIKLELEVRSKQTIVVEIEKIKIPLEGLNLRIKDLVSELENLLAFFENVSFDVFEKKIQSDMQSAMDKTVGLKKNYEVATKEITVKDALQEKIIKRIEEISKDIKSIEELELYKSITVFFNDVLKTSTIGIDVLGSEIQDLSSEEVKIRKNISTEEGKIQDIIEQLKLNSLSLDELDVNIKFTNEEIDRISNVIINFEFYINSEYKINLFNLKSEEAFIAFEQRKNSLKEKLNNNKNKLMNYQIVDKLKDKSYQFLVSEKTKVEIDVLKKEISLLVGIAKKLTLEKSKLEVFCYAY